MSRLWQGELLRDIAALLGIILACSTLWGIVVASIQKYHTHQWLTRRTLRYTLLGSIVIIGATLVTYPLYRDNLREFALHLLNEKPIRIDTGQQWKGKILYERRMVVAGEGLKRDIEGTMVAFNATIIIQQRIGDIFYGELHEVPFAPPPPRGSLPRSSSPYVGIPDKPVKAKIKGGIEKNGIFFVEYTDFQELLARTKYFEGKIQGETLSGKFIGENIAGTYDVELISEKDAPQENR